MEAADSSSPGALGASGSKRVSVNYPGWTGYIVWPNFWSSAYSPGWQCEPCSRRQNRSWGSIKGRPFFSKRSWPKLESDCRNEDEALRFGKNLESRFKINAENNRTVTKVTFGRDRWEGAKHFPAKVKRFHFYAALWHSKGDLIRILTKSIVSVSLITNDLPCFK